MKIFKIILAALITTLIIGAIFLISSEIKKSNYRNSKKFAKVWCPYGTINTELYLLQNKTFYCELVGSVYYGKYSINGDRIYFWSDDMYVMDICHSYNILDKSKKSFKLKPVGYCIKKEMYGSLY